VLDSTKVALARLGCGTSLLVVHMFTGVDSTIVAIAIFLLGVPVEYIEARKES